MKVKWLDTTLKRRELENRRDDDIHMAGNRIRKIWRLPSLSIAVDFQPLPTRGRRVALIHPFIATRSRVRYSRFSSSTSATSFAHCTSPVIKAPTPTHHLPNNNPLPLLSTSLITWRKETRRRHCPDHGVDSSGPAVDSREAPTPSWRSSMRVSALTNGTRNYIHMDESCRALIYSISLSSSVLVMCFRILTHLFFVTTSSSSSHMVVVVRCQHHTHQNVGTRYSWFHRLRQGHPTRWYPHHRRARRHHLRSRDCALRMGIGIIRTEAGG